MTLADLEAEAERMSSTLGATKRGYAFCDTVHGRLRVKHDRAAESGRGHTSHFLNSAPISRARAAQLLA